MAEEDKDIDPNKPQTPADDGKKVPTTEEKLAELEKKLGDMGQTIHDQTEFINASALVINTLAYTPELKEHFRKVITKKTQDDGDKQPAQDKGEEDKPADDKGEAGKPSSEPDKTKMMVQDVEASQRETIISQFEKDSGISEMEQEIQKEVRQKVALYLNDFGWNAKNLPLVNLKPSLEKAFMGTVGVEKLRETAKIEGATEARANSNGIMSQISGVSPKPSEQEADLTPNQKAWVEKLRVNPEKAKKTYLEREGEQTREVKAEKKEEAK